MYMYKPVQNISKNKIIYCYIILIYYTAIIAAENICFSTNDQCALHDRAQTQQYQKLLEMCHIWLMQPAALLRKKDPIYK